MPETTYRYDALYQLIEATGREADTNGIQNSQLPALASLNDSNQFVNYTRSYHYDRAGNLLKIQHTGASQYSTHITVSDSSNHGIQQQEGITARDIRSQFDAAGNQQQLQPGQPLRWNSRNQLQQVEPVPRNDGISDSESYLYDGGGSRVVKTSLHKTHNAIQTRSVIYLAGLELRSQYNGNNLTEDFQVITVGAAGRAQVRVLHWERGQPVDIVNDQLRYSFDNHLGSALIELDSDGDIISQEEYYPFGGTAVLASRNTVEAKYKTVRYSGKERDATGLYYYGYRYYQPWLGRWLSADPAGTIDGLNLYRMVRNNPVGLMDGDGLMTDKLLAKHEANFAKKNISSMAELKSEIEKLGLLPADSKQLFLHLNGGESDDEPSGSSGSSGSSEILENTSPHKIKNFHFISEINLATMPRPYYKDFSSTEDMLESAERLKAYGSIDTLLTLDLTSEDIPEFTSILADKGINYIAEKQYEIIDYFSEDELSSENIDRIVNMIKTIQNNNHKVGIHCAAGNGRSGLIATAMIINKKYTQSRINSFEEKNKLKEIIDKNKNEINVDAITYDAMKLVRKTNPFAGERTTDIKAAREYSRYLYSKQNR
ncbi:RHS repeat protein [Yersinia pestis subsp. pestis]|nr:type IV secretion protein Rhs [Yersinia pestis subsp. pestis bv. Orientalis]MBD3445380.1 RHS repeat protein [Yersinia pestis]MBF4418633.1 RHS repeat protein [Yersinia pestis subsp. pestis]MBD3449316.1 RHS repeat protein [Yersinia pestis]MBD3453268.1 RHS repeat protein [Yersinia pestis]